MRALWIVLLLLVGPLSGCLSEELVITEDGVCIERMSRGDDGTLRIVTYDIAAFSDEMLSEFTEQSGVAIELIYADDAGGILELMLQTQAAPQADLAVGLDNTYLQTALEFCLLTSHAVNTSMVDQRVMDLYSGPQAVPFDQGHVCLNYDEAVVDGENLTSPSSLWNLTEPEWTDRTVFPSPLTSSPGRAFMVATVDYFENDEDTSTNAFDWWKAMAQNGATFTTGWTEAYEIHYSGGYGAWVEGHLGDAALTVSYCHSPGVEAYYGGNATSSTSLVLPRATFHQVEYGGLINGGGNADAANAFLTYLLSEEVNSNMPENNLMKSVLNNATWPEQDGYRYHTDEPVLGANMSTERIGEEMAAWLVAWSEATR
jgi:thiamine transport system substrate-binding protein